MSTYFTSVNRNKHSIVLDLTDPGDRAVAHRPTGRADALVENFRPGKLADFGLDYASLPSTWADLIGRLVMTQLAQRGLLPLAVRDR